MKTIKFPIKPFIQVLTFFYKKPSKELCECFTDSDLLREDAFFSVKDACFFNEILCSADGESLVLNDKEEWLFVGKVCLHDGEEFLFVGKVCLQDEEECLFAGNLFA